VLGPSSNHAGQINYRCGIDSKLVILHLISQPLQAVGHPRCDLHWEFQEIAAQKANLGINNDEGRGEALGWAVMVSNLCNSSPR